MWWCGDYYCDCTRPVIQRVTSDVEGVGPFRFERLWEGTFCSNDTDRNRELQWAELREAAERLGVAMPDDAPVPDSTRRALAAKGTTD